jgi:hypothetical protein
MKRQIRIVIYLVLASVLLSTHLWAEQWKISFNGYPGTMELSGGQSNYSGRFNLHGNWEQMLDLQVYRNAIFFRRASADQKYLGVMEGGRMQGVFTQHGSGRYPWTAERTDIVSVDPIVPPLSGGNTGAIKNLALKKQARQSSTSYGGTPERAVDGNRDGNHNAGSVSHTANVPNDWWEVDLGSQKQIQEIKLWNRTDCCSERLSNFYVLVSSKPFSGGNLQVSLNDPSIWHFHHQGAAARETTVAVAGEGRYVRVQLAGQNWLSLAEVEVFGHDSSNGSTAYPIGTWRHHPGATWVVSQRPDGTYHAQEHGLGNASGPAYFTSTGSFRIDYVTRDGAVTGFYEVNFAPDGHTATGRVQELSGPRRSGNTSWTKER